MNFSKLLLAIVTLFLTVSLAVSVKVDRPGEAEEESSHIVTGTVLAIYSKVARVKGYETTYCVAEMRIEAVEKGSGLEARDLIYVRYIGAMRWMSKGPMPVGPAGHINTPSEGEKRRVCLVRNADGGWDAYYVCGFRPIAKGKP